MAQVIAGFVTSHAMAFMDPARWDETRYILRRAWADRLPEELSAEPPEVGLETDADARERYRHVTAVHDHIAARLAALAPDILVIFGNDQDENYGAHAVPQFAIFTGDEVLAEDRASGTSQLYRCDSGLARSLLEGVVDAGFDAVQTTEFEDEALIAHAFTQVLHRFAPRAEVEVLPIFVNAASPPYSSPRRCFEFGRAVREALRTTASDKRIMLCASGGLSHFTLAQFTMAGYTGPMVMGSICVEFDRRLVADIVAGDYERTASFSAEQLVEQGDGEFRQALAFLGALPDAATPERMVYEPLYRAMTGIWAGYWDLEQV